MKKIIFIVAAIMTLGLAGCSKSEVTIKGVSDLDGKKIGVQSGTTGESWVLENVKGYKLSSFKTGIDAALDLKSGSIDAVVLDELPAQEIVSRNPDMKIIRDSVFTENKEEYAIAVKKGNTELLNDINKTINAIKTNGKYEILVQCFMPADGNTQIPAIVAADSSKSIKLGTNAAFPPFEYVEGKDVVGFDISMGQLIAETCGAKLQVIDMAFDSLIPALSSGAIDFIAAGMSVTEERKKNVDFSIPYFASEQVIIVRK